LKYPPPLQNRTWFVFKTNSPASKQNHVRFRSTLPYFKTELGSFCNKPCSFLKWGIWRFLRKNRVSRQVGKGERATIAPGLLGRPGPGAVMFDGGSYFAQRGTASRQQSVVPAVSVKPVFQFPPRRSDRCRQHDNSIAPGPLGRPGPEWLCLMEARTSHSEAQPRVSSTASRQQSVVPAVSVESVFQFPRVERTDAVSMTTHGLLGRPGAERCTLRLPPSGGEPVPALVGSRGGVFVASGLRLRHDRTLPREAQPRVSSTASRQQSVVSAVSVKSVFQFPPRRSDRCRQHDNSIAPGPLGRPGPERCNLRLPPHRGGRGGAFLLSPALHFSKFRGAEFAYRKKVIIIAADFYSVS
jgi:hypothetical protein